MHLMFTKVLFSNRRKGASTNVQGDAGLFDAKLT
jgi:hypothetical protein